MGRWHLCVAALALAGTALLVLRGPTAAPGNGSVLIEGVPHVRQKPDFCGEACAEMYLRKLGKDMDQDYVFDRSGLDPLLARGCRAAELNGSLTAIGFRTGSVWYKVDAAKAEAQLQTQWRALHEDLAKGVPSIICMRTSEDSGATEHFRLVLGHDPGPDEVIYHEPAEDKGAYRRMGRDEFLKLWPLRYDPKEWTIIRIRLEPGAIEDPTPVAGATSADYAQHMMALKKKIPKEGFTVVMQRPFVVIGDESPAQVKRRAEGTVQWATDMLKKEYFTKDPNEIIDIWLFKDKQSYQRHAESIFHAKPDTPFGYFSHADRALVMNIATGGGTLVHEIVHPFVAANFPGCPAWFNEGLGTLYEQSAERDGRIVGLTNWRLKGLQETIRAGKAPSFKALTATSDYQFYNEDKGTHYAEARYLCYWLQEKGLLAKFYREFRAGAKEDPTGYETLKRILGEEDMDAFKKRWEAWVLGLRFP